MIKFDSKDKVLSNIAIIFEKRLKEKTDITLIIDKTLGEFTEKIEDGVISAGSHSQLLDACGRFLRDNSVRGEFTSHKKISGQYITTHFKNYLDAAPLEELYEYYTDLAFWGMNTFNVWFDMHHYVDMEEGKKDADRLKAMLRFVKSIGIKTSMTYLPNEAWDSSPVELRADWTPGHDGYVYPLSSHYHREICPSVPGGMEEIIKERREMMEYFKDVELDYVYVLPYDQGGCSCTACAPWGSNGLVRNMEALIPVIKEYYPTAQIILSLWQFGTYRCNEEEFVGLKEELLKGRLPEVDYLVSEPQYAEYPFREGMPRPILNFPEISMPGAIPWGGFGANPVPKLQQELWDKNGDKLDGGMPYSEGLYEDINKVICLRFYRDNQSAEATIKEYLSYEFGLQGEILDKVAKAIWDMEETLPRKYAPPYTRGEKGIYELVEREGQKPHCYPIVNFDKVFKIEKAFIEANESLPEDIKNSKKWQMLYLRAVIDGELKRNDWTRNDKTFGYFEKIVELCHLQKSGWATKPDIVLVDDEASCRQFNIDAGLIRE